MPKTKRVAPVQSMTDAANTGDKMLHAAKDRKAGDGPSAMIHGIHMRDHQTAGTCITLQEFKRLRKRGLV